MRAGFTSRELHTADRSFKWVDLLAGADNLSLFATRKIVEIRLATPKPGDEGSEHDRGALRAQRSRHARDRCDQREAGPGRDDPAWVKAIEQHGAVVEIWPIERGELPRWIQQRAASLQAEADARRGAVARRARRGQPARGRSRDQAARVDGRGPRGRRGRGARVRREQQPVRRVRARRRRARRRDGPDVQDPVGAARRRRASGADQLGAEPRHQHARAARVRRAPRRQPRRRAAAQRRLAAAPAAREDRRSRSSRRRG